MHVRVVTMRYDEGAKGFADDAVRAACEGCEVLETSEHFFTHGGVPHVTLVLKLSGGGGGGAQWRDRKNGEDLENYLPEEHRKVFRDIKKWRNDRARADGTPSYLIARNTLVFEIVKAMPKTLKDLRAIQGVGDAFVKNYGNDVMALLATAPAIAKKDEGGAGAPAEG